MYINQGRSQKNFVGDAHMRLTALLELMVAHLIYNLSVNALLESLTALLEYLDLLQFQFYVKIVNLLYRLASYEIVANTAVLH